jgi:endonuclease/exonuclease/phosphatase family metal-dependent hydrolase
MLKLMTQNINQYGTKYGLWEGRRARLAEAVRRLAPDVVALQAAAWDPGREVGSDQAGQLAALCGYPATITQPTNEGEGEVTGGSALLGGAPFDNTGTHTLHDVPNPDDVSHRVLLWCRWSGGEVPLYVVNAHFSWVPVVNVANVAATLDFVGQLAGDVILMGDLNAGPDSPGMQRLAQAGWTDVWARLRPNELGYTFEARAPSQRIDYVWANRSASQRVIAIEMVAPVEPVSDHLGLCVTLR